MKTLSAKAKITGLTLIELLVIIAVIVILIIILLPRSGPKSRAFIVICMSNLKQIDLGCNIWANDHEGKFPSQASIANRGAMEFSPTGYASLQFREISEFIPNTHVFVCPKDAIKHVAETCNNLRDENLSYFINVDATTNIPVQTILAGDRNLQENGRSVKPGLFELTTNLDMDWTCELHLRGGNMAFTDGHVQFVKTNDLNSFIRSQPLAINRFCVP